MKRITNTIEQIKYGYTPGEFFPILVEGHLSNKREYIAYKAKCMLIKRTLA